MKNLYKCIKSAIIVILCFLSTTIQATNFTWTGTTSTAWNTTTNWSPNGLPDSLDNVTIVTVTNLPVLSEDRKVNNLTMTSGTLDMSGFQLIIKGTAYFNGGTIQNGTVKPSGLLGHFGGTHFDARVEAVCGYYHMNGGQFDLPVFLTDTGYASTSGTGACVFEDSLTITHYGTFYFTMASTTGDEFNGPVVLINYSDHEIRMASADSSTFNGNIEVNSTNNGGILFGNTGGKSVLTSGNTISVGTIGFTNDFLTLKKFTQLGSTSQSLIFTSTGVINLVDCNFNGSLTISASGFLLKNNFFNNSSNFTKNGTPNYQSDGGNTYLGTTTINNNGSAGRIRLATVTADNYKGNATFNSTGQDLQVAYAGDNYFEGNITINSIKVVFNTLNGRVVFAGSSAQSINGSFNYAFKKLTINKTSNNVIANTTLSVEDSLVFTSGNLITTTSNLLTMKAGSRSVGPQDNSFVDGPVKKVGNTIFTFPTGKNGHLRTIGITAPSNLSDSYTSEYFDDGQTFGEFLDTTLAFIADCDYWSYMRNSGTSNVKVSLSWKSDECGIIDTSYLNIVTWQDTTWKDLGQGIISGNYSSGNMMTLSTTSDYGYYTFAYNLDYIQPSNPMDYASGNGFVENVGQLIGTDSLSHPEILFYGFAGNSELFLSDSCFTYSFSKCHEEYLFNLDSNSTLYDSLLTYYQIDSLFRIDLILLNPNPEYSIITNDTSQGYKNYFLGYLDSAFTHVPTYQEIKYENIFDDIDMAFYNGDEFRFYVDSSGNATDIQFYYTGQDSVRIDTSDYLNIYIPFGGKQYQVTAYEFIDNNWRAFDIEFDLTDTIVRFNLGSHDDNNLMIIVKAIHNIPSEINPQNLLKWSTYYGKGLDNQLYTVKIDADNNIYTAGMSQSTTFPVFNEIQAYVGEMDMVIIKFLSDRSRVFSTYYGGTLSDFIISLDVANNGDIGIVGYTESFDFPDCLPCDGYEQSLSGTTDGVLLKLSGNGQDVLLSTFYGGSNADQIDGIAFDSNNNMIVTGFTHNDDLPLPTGSNLGFVQAYLPPFSLVRTGFIAKFDDTNELTWRTYFGGDWFDGCTSIATDSDDNFYINGYSTSEAANLMCSPCSTNTTGKFPVCGPSGATINLESGNKDIFIASFNSSNYLLWSTMHGGDDLEFLLDFGCSIDISPVSGDIIIVGSTATDNSVATNLFPIENKGGATSAYLDDTNAGGGDAFIAMYNSSFELEWSTYYGGNGSDAFLGISCNDIGKFYICGLSTSTDFEVQSSLLGAYFDNELNTGLTPDQDGVLLKFNADYERTYSTYFGGALTDNIYDVSFQNPTWDNKHNVVIVGSTTSPLMSFPLQDIPGSVDYYDGLAINGPGVPPGPSEPLPLEGSQGFIANLYNVSTPLRIMIADNNNSNNYQDLIQIHPNPFSAIFSIRSENEEIMNICIYDVHSKRIFSTFDIQETQVSLDLSTWEAGIYIVEVTTVNDNISRTKLIKN